MDLGVRKLVGTVLPGVGGGHMPRREDTPGPEISRHGYVKREEALAHIQAVQAAVEALLAKLPQHDELVISHQQANPGTNMTTVHKKGQTLPLLTVVTEPVSKRIDLDNPTSGHEAVQAIWVESRLPGHTNLFSTVQSEHEALLALAAPTA